MARTAITPFQLVRDAGISITTGAPDATNGNIVASPGPFRARIVVQNNDSASHSLIIRCAGYTGLPGGAANSGIPPVQNAVFTQGQVGDLVIPVAASTIQFVTVDTTDRFTQSDGSMWLDWTAITSMGIYVITEPYVIA